MKICLAYPQFTINKLNNKHISKNSIPKGILGHTLVKDTVSFTGNQNEDFKKFLRKNGKITLAEYNDICKKQPHILARAQEFCFDQNYSKISPKTISGFALGLKENFDKKYGKDGYRIISIGRSPAGICEVMKNLGSNVAFMPISDVHHLMTSDSNDDRPNSLIIRDFKNRFPNTQILFDYLKTQGVKNDTKVNLVIDYCVDGITLDITSGILKEHLDNVKSIDLIKELRNINKQNSHFCYNDIEQFEYELSLGHTSNVVNVPKYSANDKILVNIKQGTKKGKAEIKKLYEYFDNFSSPLARAYSLCALDYAKKVSV